MFRILFNARYYSSDRLAPADIIYRMKTPDLTILICREGRGIWFAQCVEYDIAAQAKTFDDVIYEIERTIHAQILIDSEAGCEPFSDVPPAPKEFWEIAKTAPELQSLLPRFQLPVDEDEPEPEIMRKRFRSPRTKLVLCPT